MAEIKSTLDLVLERTKNLTLTAEEKHALALKEMEGNIRGLVQKFLSGFIDEGVLKKEMQQYAGARQKEAREVMKDILIEQFNPEVENERVLLLLRDVLGVMTDLIAAAVKEFKTQIANEQSKYIEGMRRELAAKQISGSAVVPNLERDEHWVRVKERALAGFRDRMRLNPDN
jgi:hypothetical protein